MINNTIQNKTAKKKPLSENSTGKKNYIKNSRTDKW